MAHAANAGGTLHRGIAHSSTGDVAFRVGDVVGTLTHEHCDEGGVTLAPQDVGVACAAWLNTFTAAHACVPLLADGIAVGSYGVGVLLSSLEHDQQSAFWCAPAFVIDPSAANCVLDASGGVARLIAKDTIKNGTLVVWSYPRERMQAVATGDLFVADDGSGATQLFAGRTFEERDEITVAPEAWFDKKASAIRSAWGAAVDALPSDDYYKNAGATMLDFEQIKETKPPTAPASFRERVAQLAIRKSTTTLPALPPPTFAPRTNVQTRANRFAVSVDTPQAAATSAPWTPPPELAAACGLATHASRDEGDSSNAHEITENGHKKVIASRRILCGDPVVIAARSPFVYRCIAGERQALLLPQHGEARSVPYGTLYTLDGCIVKSDLMCMATAKGLQVVCTRPLGASMGEHGSTYLWQALTWREPRYVAYSCIAAPEELKPISDDDYHGALAMVLGAYGETVALEHWRAFVEHTALSPKPYVPREGPYPPVKGFQVLKNDQSESTLHDVWVHRRAVCVYRRPLAYVAHDKKHGNGLYAMKPMLAFEPLGPFAGHVFRSGSGESRPRTGHDEGGEGSETLHISDIMEPKSGSASAFRQLIDDYWMQTTQTTEGQVADDDYEIVPGWPSSTPFRVSDDMVLPFGESSLNFPLGQVNDALFESNKAYRKWVDIHEESGGKHKQARLQATITDFLSGMSRIRVPNCMWCQMAYPQTGMALKRKLRESDDARGVWWTRGNKKRTVYWDDKAPLRVQTRKQLTKILDSQDCTKLGYLSGGNFRYGTPYVRGDAEERHEEAAKTLTTYNDGTVRKVTWVGQKDEDESIETTPQKVAFPLVVALQNIAAHQELLCPYNVPIARMLALWANNDKAAAFPQTNDVEKDFVDMLNQKLNEVSETTKEDLKQKLGFSIIYDTEAVDVHASKLPEHQLYNPGLPFAGITIQF